MRRFLPSFSALQAFEAAARHGSFTKAAEDLALTQSGISRQIAKLEGLLGVSLFERSGSRLILTEAGVEYAREVETLLGKLEAVSFDLVRGRKLDASLMIGIHPTLASRWLLPRLGGFAALHPDIPMELVAVDPDAEGSEAGFDLGILRGTGNWEGCRSTELFPESLAVVASPRLLPPGPSPDLLDFDRLPSLQNAARPGLWLQWLHLTGTPHRGRIQGLRLPHNEMLVRGAVEGLGLAVVPVHYAEKELALGDLHMPFGPAVVTSASYWVVVREQKAHKEHVRLFRNWLLRLRQRGGMAIRTAAAESPFSVPRNPALR